MKYICNNCGYIYNNEIEDVKLEQLDKDWSCPICFVSKELFTNYEEIDEYLDLI